MKNYYDLGKHVNYKMYNGWYFDKDMNLFGTKYGMLYKVKDQNRCFTDKDKFRYNLNELREFVKNFDSFKTFYKKSDQSPEESFLLFKLVKNGTALIPVSDNILLSREEVENFIKLKSIGGNDDEFVVFKYYGKIKSPKVFWEIM